MNPIRRYLAALGALVLACPFTSLPAADPKTAAPTGEAYELPKIEVKASMVCSYGIGITVNLDKTTQAITHLYVNDVAEGSDAATAGLVRGDEILSINGKKVADLKGGAKAGSDLFALLVNQRPGTRIDLEVAVRTVRKLVLSATPY